VLDRRAKAKRFRASGIARVRRDPKPGGNTGFWWPPHSAISHRLNASTAFRCRREAVKLINARGRLEAIIWFF
jgi:hypothetical protein